MIFENPLERFEPSDLDIQRVCEMLGLQPDAFHAAAGAEQRLAALRSKDSIDVEACPGSGKTTLLVTKLALLAEKWAYRTRGVCVLSHTNVARREIEKRLGATAQGRALLSYPHFVGTIHSFVNEFVALPHLRSEGKPVDVIDDELVLEWRWQQLPRNIRFGLESRYGHTGTPEQVLRIKSLNLDFSHISAPHTATYAALKKSTLESIEAGWYCHDEMLLIAKAFVDSSDQVRDAVRERFPVLFLDEVQDTDAEQTALIHMLFAEGEPTVIQQRFGDSNQAIFQDSSEEHGEAAANTFPIEDRKIIIPDSYRFGQSIADLASPLAVNPVAMVGRGTNDADQRKENAIFLFEPEHAAQVPIAFANYLRKIFCEKELEAGDFVVVGAVHKRIDDAPINHRPKTLGHYWTDYDPAIGSREPKPKTFIQYVHAGYRLSAESGDASACVEKIAEAFLRAIKRAAPDLSISLRKRKHRQMLELIGEEDQLRAEYLKLVRCLAIERKGIEPEVWKMQTAPTIEKVVKALATGAEGLAKFLIPSGPAEDAKQPKAPKDNHMRISVDGSPDINLRFGSIHSVKGETHTGTLVVDTYRSAHHLKKLKNWLTGEKRHGDGQNTTQHARMRLHYVAATRPRYLLCLAMRQDAVPERDQQQLKDFGWAVALVNPDGNFDWI